MEKDLLLSIEDAAVYFQVSAVTIRRWLKSGKLIGKKVGGQWRFSRNMLQEIFGYENNIITVNKESFRLPDWAKKITTRWKVSLLDYINNVKPDYIIVTDRTGVKVWQLLMQYSDYEWGKDLWHSTAIKMMETEELQRLFKDKAVLLFDEMMQYGNDMNEIRKILEGINSKVFSFVCVRKRSLMDSGDAVEYKAVACEDLNNELFARRATEISKLATLFEPPLDSDHLVTHASVDPNLSDIDLFTNISEFGRAYIVKYPDDENSLLTITLDNPLFFDKQKQLSLFEEFSIVWDGPCKIRFYLDKNTNICYCTFITYPTITASVEKWNDYAVMIESSSKIKLLIQDENRVNIIGKVYCTICWELAIQLCKDFIGYGVANQIGLSFNEDDFYNRDQVIATLGIVSGNRISKMISNEIDFQPRTCDYRADITSSKENGEGDIVLDYDKFSCQTDMLESIPSKHPSKTESMAEAKPRYIKYDNLFARLKKYSASIVGSVFDYELDWGTIKPIDISIPVDKNSICCFRSFCRGEYGPWYEFEDNPATEEGYTIDRTIIMVPTVMDIFTRTRKKQQYLTGTEFNKVITNLSHDWDASFGKLFFGWIPYKFGPIPVVPRSSNWGNYMPLVNFLKNKTKCIIDTRGANRKGRHKYCVNENSSTPWRRAYENYRYFSGREKDHIEAMVSMYAAIADKCTTYHSDKPYSVKLKDFSDALVVLASARNEKTAYISAWYEFSNWIERGTLLFAMTDMVVLDCDTRGISALKSLIRNFSEPTRLLYDKIEMYRHIDHLYDQIVELSKNQTLIGKNTLFESMDKVAIFTDTSKYPMANLDWACKIIRAYTSFLRQIMTICNWDTDTRTDSQKYENGVFKDAAFYLKRMTEVIPAGIVDYENLHNLTVELESTKILTIEQYGIIKELFIKLVKIFRNSSMLPDPKKSKELEISKNETHQSLIIKFNDMQMEFNSCTVCIINWSSVFTYLATEYDQEEISSFRIWLESESRIIDPRVRAYGLTDDLLLCASQDPNHFFSYRNEIISRIGCHLKIDPVVIRVLVALGMAVYDETDKAYQSSKPAILAKDLSFKNGSIQMPSSVYRQVTQEKEAFRRTDTNTDQGLVYANVI